MPNDEVQEQAKVDRRTVRTRTALREALLDLVRTRDLGGITVADVTDRANVSRPTFYDHYRGTSELAADASAAMIEQLVRRLPSLRPGSPNAVALAPRSLELFFDDLREHQRLYRSLLGPTGSTLVVTDLRRRIAHAVKDATDSATGNKASTTSRCTGFALNATFTGGALAAVAADWVCEGCPSSSAEMAAQVWPILASQYGIEMG
ncbi:hypothetical protein CH293_02475 [Rhodococcus sp. 14-2470-1b]|uniref:TetR/AcrR family transcriptional regulator n=1 Tax=Rhodococcus sp. 14-2470-1b TaxID=2023149 RepID=UPI000B9A8874|nr:TetR/AcrR family transcriptional regulator [Rhodococcus sp. 14-2470-1b]OZF57602.1 hypothetical protein CH293_02475 [Rhodococcus sp. 14-2470-1b]